MSRDLLTKQLEAIKEELKKPIAVPAEENEMADQETAASEEKSKKKKVKKVAKKAAKASKPAKKDANSVTLADLAKEAKITPQRARQKLRAAEVERDGRWSWEKGSKALASARKALDLS